MKQPFMAIALQNAILDPTASSLNEANLEERMKNEALNDHL